MRKMMTKEVTTTKVKVAKIEMVDGLPSAITLPDEVVLGNISTEQATKIMVKKHGQGVSVMSVEPNTITYEMPVEDFINLASVKEPKPETVA
jgi:hypothetical protein